MAYTVFYSKLNPSALECGRAFCVQCTVQMSCTCTDFNCFDFEMQYSSAQKNTPLHRRIHAHACSDWRGNAYIYLSVIRFDTVTKEKTFIRDFLKRMLQNLEEIFSLYCLYIYVSTFNNTIMWLPSIRD